MVDAIRELQPFIIVKSENMETVVWRLGLSPPLAEDCILALL